MSSLNDLLDRFFDDPTAFTREQRVALFYIGIKVKTSDMKPDDLQVVEYKGQYGIIEGELPNGLVRIAHGPMLEQKTAVYPEQVTKLDSSSLFG